MRKVSWSKYSQSSQRAQVSLLAIVIWCVGIFVVLPVILAFVLPAIQVAREASRRTVDRNQMRAIGLAMHNYHNIYLTLPPSGVFAVSPSNNELPAWRAAADSTSPKGTNTQAVAEPVPNPDQFESFEDYARAVDAVQKPKRPKVLLQPSMGENLDVGHHGWLTSILPFMESDLSSDLAKRVNSSLPWNDPVNSAVFQTVIPAYVSESQPPDSSPRPADGYADAHFAANSRLLRPNSMSSWPDSQPNSAANTILVGQVTIGIQPWGSPTNVRDPAAGISASPTQFSSRTVGGVHFLMCDGSVRFTSERIDQAVLEQLAGPNQQKSFFEF